MATLSCIIPTPGKGRPLRRCLDSLAGQLEAGDEVLVIGDTCDGHLPEVERLVVKYGPQFKYFSHNSGCHSWGHREINFGMRCAKTEWLSFCDDDDIYAPDALAIIRTVAGALLEPRPILFRFRAHWGVEYWNEGCRQPDGSLLAIQDAIGGHCAVFPNLPERLSFWTDRYQGDYDFIRSTLDLWPNRDRDAVWRPEVIAVARPSGPWETR